MYPSAASPYSGKKRSAAAIRSRTPPAPREKRFNFALLSLWARVSSSSPDSRSSMETENTPEMAFRESIPG